MSDSVDRVFVHALATVRRLPRTGSSRPPPSARLRLYGLYKQSMEGDVSAILPRPSLPVSSPNPNDPPSNSVHRYASRDLRTKETQAEIEKWDAWHACAGMTRTEAKRRYIGTLIDTMKEYAAGTSESRELVSELEFVWNQIKSQSGSDESESSESPTRKLERAGLKRKGTAIDPSGPGRGTKAAAAADGGQSSSIFGFSRVQSNNSSTHLSRRQSQSAAASGLRVLSPKSPRSDDDIVENEELSQIPPEAEPPSDNDEEGEEEEQQRQQGAEMQDQEDEEEEDGDGNMYRTTPSSPADPHQGSYSQRHHNQNIPRSTANNPDHQEWRSQIEAHLSRLTLELTALREQLSSSSLLSRSSFSYPINYSSLPLRKRIFHRVSLWVRWILYTFIRQFVIHLALLFAVIVYGRWKGDRRVENWVKGRLKDVNSWIEMWRDRGMGYKFGLRIL